METSRNGAIGADLEETRDNVGSHGFWRQVTTAIFYIRIVNLYAGSYLRMMPEKSLAKADENKKDRYPQACLERRRHFIALIFSSDRIWEQRNRPPLGIWPHTSNLS